MSLLFLELVSIYHLINVNVRKFAIMAARQGAIQPSGRRKRKSKTSELVEVKLQLRNTTSELVQARSELATAKTVSKETSGTALAAPPLYT
jgi:hypothetical protein